MKRMFMISALLCSIVLSSKAQVYGYDQTARLQTDDLYDDALLEMELHAMRDTAARRQKTFTHTTYSDSYGNSRVTSTILTDYFDNTTTNYRDRYGNSHGTCRTSNDYFGNRNTE